MPGWLIRDADKRENDATLIAMNDDNKTVSLCNAYCEDRMISIAFTLDFTFKVLVDRYRMMLDHQPDKVLIT